MEIIEIDKEEYKKNNYYFDFLFNKIIYTNTIEAGNTFSFFKIVDTKHKIRFVFFIVKPNEKNTEALALPQSAPYWCIESIKKIEKPENYLKAVQLIIDLISKTYQKIVITLPPLMYDNRFVSLILKSLLDVGFTAKFLDYNHYYDITSFDDKQYVDDLDNNGRRNLKIAHKNGLEFKILSNKDYESAYEVIKKNRIAKKYPLRVSKEQMIYNLEHFKGDVFAAYHDSVMISSALVFEINNTSKQLIYWGDLPDPNVSKLKPMNFMAYEMLKYYKQKSIDILDLGPSSYEGIINYGLSNFKESIGAKSTLKFTLEFNR